MTYDGSSSIVELVERILFFILFVILLSNKYVHGLVNSIYSFIISIGSTIDSLIDINLTKDHLYIKVNTPDTSIFSNADYPHITPDNSYTGHIFRSYKFMYGDDLYTVNLYINKSVYYGAKNQYKGVTCYGECPDDWKTKLYQYMALDKYQFPLYDSILNQISKYAKTDDELLEMIVSFVQQIPYDYEKSSYITFGSTRFPVETVVDRKGVCGDKSLLLTGLLSRAGYDVVLFNFGSENHMAIGVRCNCYNDYRDSGYCFIETTEPNPIGYVPDEYVGGIKLNSYPEIIRIGNGTKEYQRCEYIDNSISRFSEVLIKKFSYYLEKKYGMVERNELSQNIGSKYLPVGYTEGVTYSIPIPDRGSPDMILTYLIVCHLLRECNEPDTIIRSDDISVNICRYPYFGIKLTKENYRYYIKLLLASKSLLPINWHPCQ